MRKGPIQRSDTLKEALYKFNTTAKQYMQIVINIKKCKRSDSQESSSEHILFKNRKD